PMFHGLASIQHSCDTPAYITSCRSAHVCPLTQSCQLDRFEVLAPLRQCRSRPVWPCRLQSVQASMAAMSNATAFVASTANAATARACLRIPLLPCGGSFVGVLALRGGR